MGKTKFSVTPRTGVYSPSSEAGMPALGNAPDFAYNEFLSLSAVPSIGRNIFNFAVPLDSVNRGLYGYVYYTATSGSTLSQCIIDVEFFRNNSVVGSIPLSSANDPNSSTAPNYARSIPSLLVASSMAMENSIVLSLAGQMSGEAKQVVLHRQSVQASIDGIGVKISSLMNISGLRIWVGCISY